MKVLWLMYEHLAFITFMTAEGVVEVILSKADMGG